MTPAIQTETFVPVGEVFQQIVADLADCRSIGGEKREPELRNQRPTDHSGVRHVR